jgi:hypothetical protein
MWTKVETYASVNDIQRYVDAHILNVPSAKVFLVYKTRAKAQ